MTIQTITDAEIARIINKGASTIARWKVKNVVLYEMVYWGCLAIKYGDK